MLENLASADILSNTWYRPHRLTSHFLPRRLDVTKCSQEIVERIKLSFQKTSPGHRDTYWQIFLLNPENL